MNAPVLASDWPKARFTVAQIWALVEKGVIQPDARFELLDGEVKDMSPKGPLHEEVRRAVNLWIKTLPADLETLAETTLYLDASSFVEPDYVVFDAGLPMEALTPLNMRLIVEVAHESWAYDSGEKARRYAAAGAAEYWAINAKTREILVHREPNENGWAEIQTIAPGESIAPRFAPSSPLTL